MHTSLTKIKQFYTITLPNKNLWLRPRALDIGFYVVQIWKDKMATKPLTMAF